MDLEGVGVERREGGELKNMTEEMKQWIRRNENTRAEEKK